ncbi:MAG: dipeptide/oligopeptide/nickel ABC transporter ATP-binding protein [Geminicoccaceae bacterium]|nr:dipeptide/oligopeptide/nickel ABC transporter ATP-binding protein [Geminicoccaceae bacterium]
MPSLRPVKDEGFLLEVAGLGYRPPGVARPIVEEVSFALRPGDRVALVGASGAGKSTLARLIVRLLEPTSGSIRFRGRDLLAARGEALRRMRAEFQIVFQDPLAALGPRRRIEAQLADPLRAFGLVPRRELRARVAQLLKEVGLDPALAGRFPHELSGGQRQRVAIARALASRPRLLILDEPFSALDLSVRAQLLNLLERIRTAHAPATLFVTHDLAVVRAVADRVLVMDGGRIVEDGPVDDVLARPRAEASRVLVRAALHLPRPGGTSP